MKLFFILGNQLFPTKYIDRFKKDHTFFMAEDKGLCTYEKHHKQKILLFLSSMRSYGDNLKNEKFKLDYFKIEDKDFSEDYLKKLKKVITEKKIKQVSSFEIEDKFFEKKIYLFFNEENRNKLPKNISAPKFPKINETSHTKKLKPLIEKLFKDHPGETDNFWFATEYIDVVKLLNFFIKEKANLFGDYEDAVDQKDNILFHSALSPYINLGLITPEFVIQKVLEFHKKNKIRMNSLEGYIRQVIGWREFMRGIYQSYSQEMETRNFFKQNRKMKNSWYQGNTGLPPLDYAIKNAVNYGWSHHIERLMILSNIMNLCEIKPTIVYKWFMEMFVESSDWVMVPNVYGMGLFSDGGIFATKPYICGSAYFMKMMDFKKGEWCNVMDGLYWRFIDKNREFFLKNPRLSMMVRIFDKMKLERKKLILSAADKFIKDNTI